MCGVRGVSPYPFRHNHPNHFPPRSPKMLKQKQKMPYSPYSEDVPIMFQPRSTPPAIITSYPLSPSSQSTPAASNLACPPTPSSAAPAHLTSLLQEVLLVMDTIMCERSIVQEEDELLADLTELVVTLQEEAETLVEMADLVEEFVEEVAIAPEVGELEMWVNDLELVGLRSPPMQVTPPGIGRHERFESTDSGIVIDDGDSGIGFGVLDKVLAQPRPENGKPESEEMLDFAAWRQMAENEASPPKTPRKSPQNGLSPPKTPSKTENGYVYPVRPKKEAGEPKPRRRPTVIVTKPETPRKRSEDAIATPGSRKGKPRSSPRTPFRDSGLDFPSPLRTTPKKTSHTRWV